MNGVLWILVGLGTLVCWLLWARSVRVTLAGVREVPICRQCAYSLVGLAPGSVCPECGAAEPAKREFKQSIVWVKFDQWRESSVVVATMGAISAWPAAFDGILRALASNNVLGLRQYRMLAEIPLEIGVSMGAMAFFLLMIYGFALKDRSGWRRVQVGLWLAGVWLLVLTAMVLHAWTGASAGTSPNGMEALGVMGIGLALFGGSVPTLVVLLQFFAWVIARVSGTAELLDPEVT